jgi:hypothetical protein
MQDTRGIPYLSYFVLAARDHDQVEWNLAPHSRDGNVFHPHLYSELEKMNECDMCTDKGRKRTDRFLTCTRHFELQNPFLQAMQ